MKKITAIALSALLVIGMLIFCGCSKTPASDHKSDDTLENENVTSPNVENDSVNNEKSYDESDALGSDDSPADVSDTPAESGEISADEKFDIALSLIGENVGTLYDAIGEPSDSSYASSCMGKGEDGELYYDGFIVCTYREDGAEIVVDVYK